MTGHVTAVEIEAEDRDVRIEWGVGADGSRLHLLTRSGSDAEWTETETIIAHGESVTVETPDGKSKHETAAELVERWALDIVDDIDPPAVEDVERTLRTVLPMLDETAASTWKRSWDP